MQKKYLMMCGAALTMGLLATSCSRDMDFRGASDNEKLENAEQHLGITIDPNQDWNNFQNVTANVKINGEYGETYTVKVYENNPFASETTILLGQSIVQSGSSTTFEFLAGNGTKGVFLGYVDHLGYTYVRPATISDGQLNVTIGEDVAAARTRGVTRSAADDAVIPVRTAPDVSALISDAVAITPENNTENTTVRHFVIPAGTTWNDNIPIIQASDPNDKSIVSVYVLGTLNVNANQRINGGYGGDYMLIVGDGGVVNIAKGVTLNTNTNQGSGYTGAIHVLAGGTIQGEGTMEFSNGTTDYNYNAGIINVGTLNNNGGTLYNTGLLQADVLQGGGGRSIYENQGKVHIGTTIYGASTSNMRIRNNCWWEVDDDFFCRNIIQGEGAYIKAQNLGMSGSQDGTGDPVFIYAKANSLIEVPGYVALNGVAIDGPSSGGYGYLQFGTITGDNGDKSSYEWYSNELAGITTNYNHVYGTIGEYTGEYMTTPITNNIRLSVDNPITQNNRYTTTAFETVYDMLNGTKSYTVDSYNDLYGEWGTWDKWPQQGNGNAVLVAKGQVNDVVTESECSPGLTIVPPTKPKEENPIYSYAFEDMELGDYDLNDVVLQVQEVATGENAGKLQLKLVAAGATLDNYIWFNNEVVKFENGESEIHLALGVAKGTMVNTGAGATASPVVAYVTKPEGAVMNRLPIELHPNGQPIVKIATTGQDPHGVVIPGNWLWPRERVCIVNAYPDFAKFAEDVTNTEAAKWYTTHVTGKVYE